MTTPAVVYRHRAMSSLRARATTVVLRIRLPRRPDPLVEPQAERRGRLVLQPQPGELDHCCPQPRVARFGYTLLVINRAALPWRWRQTGVGGHLPAVVELAEQALRPEDGGGLGANALQLQQHGRRRGRRASRRLE